jgi:zinc transport system ATP-binding protein
MSSEIVTTALLSCSYREGRVLEDVSFQVKRGDYVGIVGPNGSGKSTLVKALLGLVAINKGSATLFGSPLSKTAQSA